MHSNGAATVRERWYRALPFQVENHIGTARGNATAPSRSRHGFEVYGQVMIATP